MDSICSWPAMLPGLSAVSQAVGLIACQPCRYPQEIKFPVRGRVLEARVAVSRSQLVFGSLPTHSTADENLVLENLCPQLPARFRIPAHSAYHCQPSEGGPIRGHLSLREQE